MSLIRDITKVSAANIISLFAAVVSGFIVPAFLTVEQYAYLKTYTLIMSFVGMLHLGFTDGVYIRYGGKYLNDLDTGTFKMEKRFFILFQIAVSLIILITGLLINKPIIICIAAAVLPYNLLSYYQLFYQSVGHFNIYSSIRLLIPFIILISNILLIYIFKISNYIYYIVGEIAAYFIVVVYLELRYSATGIKKRIRDNIPVLKENFSIGVLIMTGNLALIVFSTLGRWAVKLFMTDADFAYFSFASSILQILTLVMSSVAMTFYPYLSRIHQKNNTRGLKIQLMIIGAYLSAGYFVFSFIIREYIPKYDPSLGILGVLFASFPAYAVINALYINLYKVHKDGRKYISVIILNLVIACMMTVAAILFRKDIMAVSFASTLSYYFWMFYSSKDFNDLKPTLKELLFIVLYLMSFTGSMLLPHPLLGLSTYAILIAGLSFLYYNEVKEIFLKSRNALKI